jgi:predicted AAA+ superfamily ATPase
MAFPEKSYVSFEAPDVRSYAQSDPRGLLAEYADGAVLDEVQRVPELLSYLQTEVDERPRKGRFVLTGSANFQLIASIAQSLAGRTALLSLLPCSVEEIRRFSRPPRDLWSLIVRGGYPAIYERRLTPPDWYGSYVATYVERDLRQILNVGDLSTFQTFLRMCATRSGQLLNLSGLGADCGINHGTARSWISVLETSFLAFRMPTLTGSIGKRLVKTPKLHFYDTGLLCYLLGIHSADQLRAHPLRGAVFETWVASELLKAWLHRGLPPQISFFRDRKGLEVDIVLRRGNALVAVETKSAETVAADFFVALHRFADLAQAFRGVARVERVLVYAGTERQRRSEATVLPWSRIVEYDWVGQRAGRRSTSGRRKKTT